MAEEETKEPNRKERIFGLDVFRALAIIFVLLAHTSLNVFTDKMGSLVVSFGLIGVELFFILSGFLIGGIIIRDFIKSDKYKIKDIKGFWIRRWFRTLPNYYLVFIIFYIYFTLYVGCIGYKNLSHITPFILFLQNLYKTQLPYFDISWSLAIEEWFYILFPLTLLLVSKVFKNKQKALLISIISIIIFSNVLRIKYALEPFRKEDWDMVFRKIVVLRLDSIAFGVLIAYFTNFYKGFWEKNKKLLFSIGLIIAFICIYLFYGFYERKAPEDFFMRTFFFSIFSLSLSLLIPFMVTFKEFKSKLLNKFVLITSLTSYSIYLIHTIILGIFYTYYPNRGLIRMIVLILLIYVVSYFMYRLYEKPMTNLRERFSNRSETKKN